MVDLSWASAVLPLAGAGFGVGFLVGLTGVGGGALMTPLLLSTFGVAPALAVALPVSAVAIVLYPLLMKGHDIGNPDGSIPPRTVPTVLFGVALGLLVTLTSVGAGAIGVVVLAFLFPTLPAKRIVGTDIAHAVPLTLVAGSVGN